MTATFSTRTFEFLTELSLHNERPWFEANKQRYEDDVREPARAFIRRMAPLLAELSPELVADDRKLGGSLMRIYRDTRFGKDKTPYKTNVGIQFRLGRDKDVHAPGLYVHIAADELFIGAGMWRPPGDALNAIRKRIDEEPDAWSAVVNDPALGQDLRLSDGEPLSRPPRGYAKDHPHVEDLKRRSFLVMGALDVADVVADDFAERVATRFRAAVPLMQFLCDALGLPF
ncbi:MAG: DUF2461 domain-containing protein [Deltaproteobacteria bacterium]|nr:MAG: DUF2461 domain-containing protein [Deltaproteobacteria bacterium]